MLYRAKLLASLVVAFAFLIVSAAQISFGQVPEAPPPTEDKGEMIKIREQTIYIPFSKLRDSFEKEGRGVFLPYDQFQELWKRARAVDVSPTEPTPLVNSIISEIESEATVEKDVVKVKAVLSIEVFKKGWQEILLRLNDAAIQKSTIGDQPARIVAKPEGYVLLVENKEDKPMSLKLNLEYAKAYTKTPGQNRVAFSAPQASLNKWRFRVPETGIKVNIHPLIAANEETTPPAAEGAPENKEPPKETVLLAFVGAAPEVVLEWNPKSEGASGLEALANVSVEQQVIFDEGVMRTKQNLAYEISRAEISTLNLEFPADQRIVNVFDENVKNWEATTEGEVQKVKVNLYQPVRGAQRLLVELERFEADFDGKTVKVPYVNAIGTTQQRGILVVRLGGGLRAEVGTHTSLLQVDATELPGAFAGQPWDFAYRYSALPFELGLTLKKLEPRVQAEQLVETFVALDKYSIVNSTLFTIERAGIFQFQYEIPDGYTLRDVRGIAFNDVAAAVVDSHQIVEGTPRKLVVNLASKAFGKVGLSVELEKKSNLSQAGVGPENKSTETFLIPHLVSDTVERQTGKVVLFCVDSLKSSEGKLEQLQQIGANEIYTTIPTQSNRFGNTQLQKGYSFAQNVGNFVFDIEKRVAFITSNQVVSVDVRPGTIDFRWRFFVDILYSPQKNIRIDVPNEVADKLNMETSNFSLQKLVDPMPAPILGYTAMTVSSQSELIGRVNFEITHQQDMEEVGVGNSIVFTVHRISATGSNRDLGQIVISKTETFDIRESNEPIGLRPIDPQTDIENGLSFPDAARAFAFTAAWDLSLRATRYELEEVKTTSVERGLIRTVVGRDNRTSVQAIYRMRSAMQRLEIQLPPNFDSATGFNVNPVRINGMPVTLELGGRDQKGTNSFFVPLANQNPDVPFILDLRYSLDGNEGDIQIPTFPGNPAAQKVFLEAYVPEELVMIGSLGPWTNYFAHDWRDSVLRGRQYYPDEGNIGWVLNGVSVPNGTGTDFEVDGRVYRFSTLRPTTGLSVITIRETFLNLLVFIVVVCPGVLLLLRPWRDRIVALGSLLVALVIVAIFFPSLAAQTLDEVLGGSIMIVIALWIITSSFATLRALKDKAINFFATRRTAQVSLAGSNIEVPVSQPVSTSVETRESSNENGSSSPSSTNIERAKQDEKTTDSNNSGSSN